MEIDTFTKDILKYHRDRANVVFDILADTQEANEKITRDVIDALGFIPDEGKQLVTRLYDLRRNVRDEYRKVVHTLHDQIETYIALVPVPQPAPELTEN